MREYDDRKFTDMHGPCPCFGTGIILMTEDAHLSSQAIEALRARFQAQSRKAQAYYTVMHRIRSIVGNDDAANVWMNEPLPGLDGKTPAQLVSNGRASDVLDFISSLKTGSSG